MEHGIHFISGLPRSGSTLLAELLRQNPRFSAGMTSPVSALFGALMTATSARTETAAFVTESQRKRLLRACFDAYYADVHPTKLVFDTSRAWTTKLPALVRLFPQAKMICCVRNPAWILDSIESLIRRNAFDLSGIFNFEPGGTVYSRIAGLAGGDGMLGYAWNALREAVFGPQAQVLMLLRYETLAARPLEALAAIYEFLGEPHFAHDPEHIEQSDEMIEFDRRLGTPGLHHVRPAVRAAERPTILPPDLFARYEQDRFWENNNRLPASVRVV